METDSASSYCNQSKSSTTAKQLQTEIRNSSSKIESRVEKAISSLRTLPERLLKIISASERHKKQEYDQKNLELEGQKIDVVQEKRWENTEEFETCLKVQILAEQDDSQKIRYVSSVQSSTENAATQHEKTPSTVKSISKNVNKAQQFGSIPKSPRTVENVASQKLAAGTCAQGKSKYASTQLPDTISSIQSMTEPSAIQQFDSMQIVLSLVKNASSQAYQKLEKSKKVESDPKIVQEDASQQPASTVISQRTIGNIILPQLEVASDIQSKAYTSSDQLELNPVTQSTHENVALQQYETREDIQKIDENSATQHSESTEHIQSLTEHSSQVVLSSNQSANSRLVSDAIFSNITAFAQTSVVVSNIQSTDQHASDKTSKVKSNSLCDPQLPEEALDSQDSTKNHTIQQDETTVNNQNIAENFSDLHSENSLDFQSTTENAFSRQIEDVLSVKSSEECTALKSGSSPIIQNLVSELFEVSIPEQSKVGVSEQSETAATSQSPVKQDLIHQLEVLLSAPSTGECSSIHHSKIEFDHILKEQVTASWCAEATLNIQSSDENVAVNLPVTQSSDKNTAEDVTSLMSEAELAVQNSAAHASVQFEDAQNVHNSVKQFAIKIQEEDKEVADSHEDIMISQRRKRKAGDLSIYKIQI